MSRTRVAGLALEILALMWLLWGIWSFIAKPAEPPPTPAEEPPRRILIGRGCTIRGVEGSMDLIAACADGGVTRIVQRAL